MTSLKTSIKTITYLSDIGCLEIQGASLALDDLVRPFYLLDGRNIPDFRSSIGAQYGEFLGNGDNVGKLLEWEYFTVRGYQKGTVHIVFKRSDLVEKLNDIIARHYPGALPPRV